MKNLFNATLYEPLYNALVGLIDIIPGGNMGLAVIALTIVVKFILFPLSASSIRTQIKMKEIDGEMKEIREEHKDNREEMGKKMLELYRKNKINPFAGIFLILIQLPIIFALYFVFARAGFPDVNPDLLYSFIPVPQSVDTNFLGFIDLSASKNVLLAFLAGLSQYYQMKFVIRNAKKRKDEESKNDDKKKEDNPMEDIMEKMQFQMKFIMPIVTFFISFGLISVVGLYWFVSNIFAIGQELYIQKKIRKPQEN